MALQKPRQIETTPSEALITLADNLQLPVDSIVPILRPDGDF